MITCTTMVLLILVEVTRPILVLRLPCFFSVVVSAIYFFLDLAAVFFLAGLAVLPLAAALVFFFLALLPAAAFFELGFGSASPAAASVLWPLLGAAMPSSFSRITVCTRATSLRRPRILVRLSVCPIFSWNLRRKSWSLSSCCWCSSSESVRFLSFSTSIVVVFSSRAPQRFAASPSCYVRAGRRSLRISPASLFLAASPTS